MKIYTILTMLTMLSKSIAFDILTSFKFPGSDFEMDELMTDIMRPLSSNAIENKGYKKSHPKINENGLSIPFPPILREPTTTAVPGLVREYIQPPIPNSPMSYPVYVMPQPPLVVPMHTFFEPVKHNHPPIHKIRQLIEEDEKRWQKDTNKPAKSCSSETLSSDSESSDTSSSEGDFSKGMNPVDYYDDIIHVNH